VLKQLQWFLEARFLVLPMEALLLEEEVLRRETGIIARAQRLTVVSGGPFPWTTYRIPSR
jgi:hypothetical protein